jgi:DNA sulfur modification protein DndD
MKLTSLRLCNFRQFYGQTPEIRLAGDAIQNTTVIHGNNGAGKTTLLNAFTWVLYGKFTAAFAESDRLVNSRAIAESELGTAVECWVELAWEHDGKRYRAKRSCRAYKLDDEVRTIADELLYLYIGDLDGKWLPSPQPPDEVIGRILPTNLHQYFFFDGERIEQIVRQDKRLEIAEATKILLGVEVLNRAIVHLTEARKTLAIELSDIGDADTKLLLKSQQQLLQEIDRLQARQGEIDATEVRLITSKQAIESQLLTSIAAKEIQTQRQQLESEKAGLLTQLNRARANIKQAISSQGYTVSIDRTLDEFNLLVGRLRQRGELNQGISREFLHQMIADCECICGTELKPQTTAYDRIQIWLARASIAAIEETTIALIHQAAGIERQRENFWQTIAVENQIVASTRTEIDRIETQLDRIETQLRRNADVEIREFQQQLDRIDLNLRDLALESGGTRQQIVHLESEIRIVTKQIDRQKLNQAKQILAQRRLQAAQAAIDKLTTIRHQQEQEFRTQLELRVQQIFAQISVSPYIPQITDKYELILVENSSGKAEIVPASTGENQILSLSFISGIIDRVREWSAQKILAAPASNTFPIVMDSPFGSLDEISRRRVAQIVPNLANQLIVLVSQTQWRGEVETEVIDKIGARYVLTYYSAKPDCIEDRIEIDGRMYPTIERSPNGFDYTVISTIAMDNMI